MGRTTAMHVAVDVHYWEGEDRARAALVGFDDWSDDAPRITRTREHSGLEPYQPGEFFRRELPCLLPLLREVGVPVETVVVDGYVDLGPGRPGLGRHLWDDLGRSSVVVGVAKNAFAGAEAFEVRRGDSGRPLFVTSTGDVAEAAGRIQQMAGDHRLPALLKAVDRLARDG